MSRCGYSDDIENWSLIRWRGAVTSAMRGKRGQEFLIELLAALDALPKKELVANELEVEGSYCTLGAIGAARGVDLKQLDPNETKQVSEAFGIANAMAREIMFENDEGGGFWQPETPAERWARMREWVARQIKDGEA